MLGLFLLLMGILFLMMKLPTIGTIVIGLMLLTEIIATLTQIFSKPS